MKSADYPRMMFHRTKPPVTVSSEEQEKALGRDWSRVIWPAEPVPVTREPEPPRQEVPLRAEESQHKANPHPAKTPHPKSSVKRKH